MLLQFKATTGGTERRYSNRSKKNYYATDFVVHDGGRRSVLTIFGELGVEPSEQVMQYTLSGTVKALEFPELVGVDKPKPEGGEK